MVVPINRMLVLVHVRQGDARERGRTVHLISTLCTAARAQGW